MPISSLTWSPPDKPCAINRLRSLPDGAIQPSQAALIAHRPSLHTQPEVLELARHLLEYIEAHLRARGNLLVIANLRGEDAHQIAKKCSPAP